MPPQYSEHHEAYLERYLSTGEARIIGSGREVVGRRKNGSTFPMYLSVGDVTVPEFRGFIGIVHDLTEQKATERKLAQAREILQSIAEVGTGLAFTHA